MTQTVQDKELSTLLVTDCGSTTTKALLFEKTSTGWRQTSRGEAPTTVEAPVADVTVGALNAFQEIEELSGKKILSDNPTSPFLPKQSETEGIDLYLSTSSAGGGLQMVVAGVVKEMTTESAERAALGAGAIVLDALSADDVREDYERVKRIRHLRPDIFLLTGGVDGGALQHVLEGAELIRAAAPKPRFGNTLKLPVIFAGNQDAAAKVAEILSGVAQVQVVPNIRPTLDKENLAPVREAIHELFLSHVMSHSPGYDKLLSWSPYPVMATPHAVGTIIETYARESNQQVLSVDIGGATTDVFSVWRNEDAEYVYNRTVSANLGMSYSIAHVLLEAGAEAIGRWLPYELSITDLKDRLRNKMIRPTSIPETKEDLWLEQAVCREALRLSLLHHKSLAVGLGGKSRQRTISELFTQKGGRSSLVNLFALDVVIGSGGVLSHAPHRLGAALMMLDGFELRGITEIAVDSIFMMPHLGVLSTVQKEAAYEIFHNECLVRIVHSLAPVYSPGVTVSELARVFVNGKIIGTIERGKVTLLPFSENEEVTVEIEPLHNSVDMGNGRGRRIQKRLRTAQFGFLLDGRNRPLEVESFEYQRKLFDSLGLTAE